MRFNYKVVDLYFEGIWRTINLHQNCAVMTSVLRRLPRTEDIFERKRKRLEGHCRKLHNEDNHSFIVLYTTYCDNVGRTCDMIYKTGSSCTALVGKCGGGKTPC
jgi:hypothetical protein